MNGKFRYYLIACGTSHYKNYDEDKQLASVETDIKKVVNLFTHHFGYKQVLTNLQLNPKAGELTKQFADWLQDKDRCKTDRVIFYYSGHGESVIGDKHYLLMEDTEPNKMPQTSLATEDLVRPLNNEGVKIEQILYIIDTCFSQSGAGDVTEFASSVIQQFQSAKRKNAVHAIAASRVKQFANQGVFSNALSKIIKGWTTDDLNSGFIELDKLVDKINQEIASETQRVVYDVVGLEETGKFLPILPKNLQTWEEKRHEFIEELLCTLKEKLDDSLFFINSFLLSSKFIEEFVLDEPDLKDKLKDLAIKPVSDGFCPLIACSEWCRLRFSNQGSKKLGRNLALKIGSWQDEVMKYRNGANLDEIKKFVKQSFDEFKRLIKEGELRIQIEIKPKVDGEKNTGLQTGSFFFNMNLWIKNQELPLGRFAENVVLKPQGVEKSDSLRMCLKKEDFLSNLIRQARYSLPESVKLTIEIFLPFDFYQESLERICFKSGKKMKPLGAEYPIFINSFERYFDEDFREIRDRIYEIKKDLWKNDNNLDSEFYYIGTEPSESDLDMIEDSKAIAVWSRCGEKHLTNHINISQWKEWPQKVHELRQNNNDMEVTLFWDDLYPKPKPSLLNTNVVE